MLAVHQLAAGWVGIDSYPMSQTHWYLLVVDVQAMTVWCEMGDAALLVQPRTRTQLVLTPARLWRHACVSPVFGHGFHACSCYDSMRRTYLCGTPHGTRTF